MLESMQTESKDLRKNRFSSLTKRISRIDTGLSFHHGRLRFPNKMRSSPLSASTLQFPNKVSFSPPSEIKRRIIILRLIEQREVIVFGVIWIDNYNRIIWFG